MNIEKQEKRKRRMSVNLGSFLRRRKTMEKKNVILAIGLCFCFVGVNLAETVEIAYHDGVINKTQQWQAWYNDGPHGPGGSGARDNSLVVNFDTSSTGLQSVSSAKIRFYGKICPWDWGKENDEFKWALYNKMYFDISGYTVSYTLKQMRDNYGMPVKFQNGIGEDDTANMAWVEVPVSINGIHLDGTTGAVIYLLNGGGPTNTSIGIGIDTDASTRNSGRGNAGWNDKNDLRWNSQNGPYPGEYLVTLILDGQPIPEPATIGLLSLGAMGLLRRK